MAHGVRTHKGLPDTAKVSSLQLAQLGVREGQWTYRTVKVVDLDIARRIQIRNDSALAPFAKVAHLKEVLDNHKDRPTQLLMPPLILTQDMYVVDGNTRTEALHRAGWDEFPAFVLDMRYQNAPAANEKLLRMIGTRFNLVHGEGLSRGQIEELILNLANEDESPEDLARTLGLSKNMVTSVIHAQAAKERATRLGLKLNGKATRSHLAALGTPNRAKNLTDPVFAKLITLVTKGGVSTTDQGHLLKRVDEATSEEAKVTVVAQEVLARGSMVDGGNKVPSLAVQLRQRLGFMTGKNAGLFIETTPESAANHRKMVRESISFLEDVLEFQRTADTDRERALAEAGVAGEE